MITNLMGSETTSLSSTTRYMPAYAAGFGANSTVTTSWTVAPVAMTLSNFYVKITNADAAQARTFTVVTGATPTATSLVATIAANGTTANDTTHTVSLNPGDLFAIQYTSSASTGSGNTQWTLAASCATKTSMLLFTANVATGTTFPVYYSVQGSGSNNQIQSFLQESVFPTSGTLKNAYLKLNSAIAAGKNVTYTLNKNGVDTALAITINTAVDNGSDLTHSVSVSPGDLLYWHVTSSAAPASKTPTISMEFDPDTDGESVHLTNSLNGLSTSAVQEVSIPYNPGGAGTLANNIALSQGAVWEKMYVHGQSAIASGSYLFQLGQTLPNTVPSVTITSASTDGNDTTNTINTSDGNQFVIFSIPSSPNAATIYEFGLVSYIPPPIGQGILVNQAVKRTASF